MLKKNILIYGATGSIGNSTLNLIRNNKEKFNIVGLTCNENIKKIIKLADEFNCKNIGIGNIELINKHINDLKHFRIYKGIEEFNSLVTENDVDIIIFAISGSAPLNLLMELAESGKIIGLVNKECIICLGKIFLDKANAFFTKIVPLDSEHNAIYQLIKNKDLNSINKYTITASGGNFYNYSYHDLKRITPEQAITHPKWSMGNKITVDSSTLMNKGLEIIEACILFDIDISMINVVIHPESVVHGLVEFNDSSVHAFLSQPNMEVSISSVLFQNNSNKLNDNYLDLTKIESLNFQKVDNERFNAIDLSKLSLEYGGLAPAVLNYANEIMVNLFLKKRILFTDIVSNNEKILNLFISNKNNKLNYNIDDINHSFEIIDNYMLTDQIIIA